MPSGALRFPGAALLEGRSGVRRRDGFHYATSSDGKILSLILIFFIESMSAKVSKQQSHFQQRQT